MTDPVPPPADHEAAARIAQRLDEPYAPAWNPEPGDKLIGRLESVDHFPGQYGTYPILTVDTGRGRVAVHALTEVLRGQLRKSSPRLGELVGFKYEGKVEREGAPDYHSYRVVVDRPGADFDWGEPAAATVAPGGPPGVRPLDEDPGPEWEAHGVSPAF